MPNFQTQLPVDANGNPLQTMKMGTPRTLAFNATASSAALNSNVLMLCLDQPAHIYIGPARAATVTDQLIPANQVVVLGCNPTDVLNIIKTAAGSAGNAYFTPGKVSD